MTVYKSITKLNSYNDFLHIFMYVILPLSPMDVLICFLYGFILKPHCNVLCKYIKNIWWLISVMTFIFSSTLSRIRSCAQINVMGDLSLWHRHTMEIYIYLHPCCFSAGKLFLMTAEVGKRETGKKEEKKNPLQLGNTGMMSSLCCSAGTTLWSAYLPLKHIYPQSQD